MYYDCYSNANLSTCTIFQTYKIFADTVLKHMYTCVLCVCNFKTEKLNVRQKPSVFGNASGTAIGMVGVHTIDFGPLGVFHAMA